MAAYCVSPTPSIPLTHASSPDTTSRYGSLVTTSCSRSRSLRESGATATRTPYAPSASMLTGTSSPPRIASERRSLTRRSQASYDRTSANGPGDQTHNIPASVRTGTPGGWDGAAGSLFRRSLMAGRYSTRAHTSARSAARANVSTCGLPTVSAHRSREAAPGRCHHHRTEASAACRARHFCPASKSFDSGEMMTRC